MGRGQAMETKDIPCLSASRAKGLRPNGRSMLSMTAGQEFNGSGVGSEKGRSPQRGAINDNSVSGRARHETMTVAVQYMYNQHMNGDQLIPEIDNFKWTDRIGRLDILN